MLLSAPMWKQTACILCECNCGIEVRLGDDGQHLRAHPRRQGASGFEGLHVREGAAARLLPERRGERVLHPLRRRADGTFEEIDWDTAIPEVAARLGGGARRPRRRHDLLLRRRRAGQPPRRRLRRRPRSRRFGARTGPAPSRRRRPARFWVNGMMFGRAVRGDFEHCEVALFIGKNPWHRHGIPHARTTLKAIANDPTRAMIVIDPRRTETAELADFHLQVRPGRDAWLLAAMVAVMVEEDLVDRAWLADHAVGLDEVAGRASRRCRSPSTARSAASTRTLVRARRPADRRPRRASPCSRTSACR